MNEPFNRRRFVATSAAVGLGVALGGGTAVAADKPALLGGKRTRSQPFPSWPVSGAARGQGHVGHLAERQVVPRLRAAGR